MTVERIEWQCPGCQRKFAIPASQPRPKLCPHCQQTATAIPKRPIATAPQHPPMTAEVDDPEGEFDFAAPSPSNPQFDPSPRRHLSRPVSRPRYEVLRSISLWFKILAGLLVVLLFFALTLITRVIIANPPGIDRVEMVFWWGVTFVSGITVIMEVYAFAILLLVAMDIEHNTRQD